MKFEYVFISGAAITAGVVIGWLANDYFRNIQRDKSIEKLQSQLNEYINYNQVKYEQKSIECDYYKNFVNEAQYRARQKRLENRIIKPNTSYIN